MPDLIKLTKPWGGHPVGAVLAVLAPGEDPAAGKVDPVRAATLLAQKLAVNESAAKPAPATAKKED